MAVVGATGAVGEAMLEILAERKFPASEVFALASANSVGKTVRYGAKSLRVAGFGVLRFLAFAARIVLGRGESVGRVRSDRGGGGMRCRRQHVAFSLRRRHTAGRSRGQSRTHRRLRFARHHRESELLDHTARRRAEADTRPGNDRSSERRDLPVGLGRGSQRDGGAGAADRAMPQRPAARARG